MIFYFLKRLISAVPTLLVLMTVTFFVMKVVPGGPFDSEKALPPDVKANIESKYHFNEPVWKQYLVYMTNLAQGDLGISYRYLGSRTVNEIIRETLPVSLELGIYAVVFSVLLGVPMGVLSAYKKNTWFDFSTMFFAVAGVSLPSFLVASGLILLFSVYLGLLPPALWEGWQSVILPSVTLGLRPMALLARITRASVIETLSTDYIRTAEAKGLAMGTVLFKHALKNALVPVVTVMGPLTAAIITGSFVVEVIFAIPGMGKHFVTAVMDRDYTLIMGVTMVYGAIVILANLAVDLMYAWIDPRMRVEA